MPNYDYFCEKCKGSFEFFQSMKDEPLKTCPKQACLKKNWGKGNVQRQIGTGAGLIFKGSGFYITDYRSENYKSAAKTDSSAASPPKTEGAAKSDSPASGGTKENTSKKTKKTGE